VPPFDGERARKICEMGFDRSRRESVTSVTPCGEESNANSELIFVFRLAESTVLSPLWPELALRPSSSQVPDCGSSGVPGVCSEDQKPVAIFDDGRDDSWA
jgi:hypothetical protein